MQKNRYNLRSIIVLGLLAAIGGILTAYLSIEIPMGGLKAVDISLAPIPVMLAGIFFGPLAGAATGFLADAIGFFIGVQFGAYNPIFGISMALFGVIAGLFYLKSRPEKLLKLTIMAATAQIICSVIINTSVLVLLFPSVFTLAVLLPARAVSALVELPIYVGILFILSKRLRFLFEKTAD